MKGLVMLINWIIQFVIKFKNFIPPGFAAIFVLTNFLATLSSKGLNVAFEELAKNLFAAEITINETVQLAITNSPEYGVTDVFAIISSLIILWMFLKWFTKFLIKISGSQAEWGAFFISLFILFVIEMSVGYVVNQDFSFIPVKDGILFLFFNLQPVLQNIHIFGYGFNKTPVATNVTLEDVVKQINLTNSTA